ncbi:MAG: CHAT domain-containing protein [Bacteroidales bacterium]|nr:CHAT domain-containing protein [Bacteroidales bacterium]
MSKLLLTILFLTLYILEASAQDTSSIERLIKANQQTGNYSLAQKYIQQAMKLCLTDSVYASQKFPELIKTYYDLAYLNHTDDRATEEILPYFSQLNKKDRFTYPKSFQMLLGEFRGNYRDYRFSNASSKFELFIDPDQTLDFYNQYVPDPTQMNDFNKLYTLLSKADIYMLGGDFEASEETLESIKTNFSEMLNKDKKLSLYIMLMQELIAAYSQDYELAIDLAKQNLSYMDSNQLRNCWEYASTLSRLQFYTHEFGEHQESVLYGERQRNPDFDKRNPLVKMMYPTPGGFASQFKPLSSQQIKILLSDSYYMIGEIDKAEALISDVLDIDLKDITNAALSKEDINHVDAYVMPLIEEAPKYALRYGNDKFAEYVYDGALAYKQLSLNAESFMRNIVMRHGNEATRNAYQKLESAKAELDGATPNQVDSIANRIAHLERQIYNNIKVEAKNALSMSWKSVAEKLKSDEVAIEFVECTDDDGTQVYAASVIDSSCTKPFFLKICNKEDIAEIKNSYTSTEVYDKLWSKFETLLKDKSRIYFSPTGDLYNIGIEYAPFKGDKVYDFYRLSSTRELLNRTESSQISIAKASLFGGIKYDLNQEERQEQVNVIRGLHSNDIKGSTSKESFDYDNAVNKGSLSYLPGTKVEIEDISKCLSDNKVKAVCHTGINATEEEFKALSGQEIDILHVATHGFYIPQNVKSKIGKLYGYLDKRSTMEDLSLTRSGIMMTGAVNSVNNRDNKVMNIDDGVLTAREISRLDFSKTNLIILSACQTGLGDVESEGVFGLQRGLKKAGASSMIMSLWKVDDEATRILMTNFYNNLMKGQSIHDAFKASQSTLREIQDGKFDKPMYWAAFVLIDVL